MADQMWAYAKPYVIGYIVALFWGQIVISFAVNGLWAKLGLPRRKRHAAEQSTILGLTETVLYMAAFQVEKPEFIVAWLGLKTVIRWRHWEHDIPIPQDASPPKWILGRNAYNLFLFGNALVVMFAAVGWKVTEFTAGEQAAYPQLFVLLAAVFLGSIALLILVGVSKEYKQLEGTDPQLSRNNRNGP